VVGLQIFENYVVDPKIKWFYVVDPKIIASIQENARIQANLRTLHVVGFIFRTTKAWILK
jgi:hypothetical protein